MSLNLCSSNLATSHTFYDSNKFSLSSNKEFINIENKHNQYFLHNQINKIEYKIRQCLGRELVFRYYIKLLQRDDHPLEVNLHPCDYYANRL